MEEKQAIAGLVLGAGHTPDGSQAGEEVLMLKIIGAELVAATVRRNCPLA